MRAVPLSAVPRGAQTRRSDGRSPPYSNDVAQRAGELRVEGEERLLLGARAQRGCGRALILRALTKNEGPVAPVGRAGRGPEVPGRIAQRAYSLPLAVWPTCGRYGPCGMVAPMVPAHIGKGAKLDVNEGVMMPHDACAVVGGGKSKPF